MQQRRVTQVLHRMYWGRSLPHLIALFCRLWLPVVDRPCLLHIATTASWVRQNNTGSYALVTYTETLGTPTVSASTLTFDSSIAQTFRTPLTSSVTMSISTPFSSGRVQSFTTIFDATGSFFIDWPSSIEWLAGSPPIIGNNTNIIDFFTTDGGNVWYGSVVDSGSGILLSPTLDPSASVAGDILYTRALGGKYIPRFMGSSGLPSALQPVMFAHDVTMWLPGTSTTAAINFTTAWTMATTQVTPAIANTNFMTQMTRATFTTTTTAANTSGVRSSAPVAWIGNSNRQGGFFFAARFGILTYSSTIACMGRLISINNRTFYRSECNCQYMCYDKRYRRNYVAVYYGQCNCQLIQRFQLVSQLPAGGTGNIFDFYMYCPPNGTSITFQVEDVTTGAIYVNSQAQTLTLPSNTVMLTAHAECQNVTGGAGTQDSIILN